MFCYPDAKESEVLERQLLIWGVLESQISREEFFEKSRNRKNRNFPKSFQANSKKSNQASRKVAFRDNSERMKCFMLSI